MMQLLVVASCLLGCGLFWFAVFLLVGATVKAASIGAGIALLICLLGWVIVAATSVKEPF